MHNNKECSDLVSHKIIKISERESSTLYINNNNQKSAYIVRYDGCSIKNKKGADFIIVNEDASSFCVIELKGRNVEEAYTQIKQTLINLSTNQIKIKKSGVIVNKVWPKASTSLQKLQQDLAKNLNARLHAARHASSKDIDMLI